MTLRLFTHTRGILLVTFELREPGKLNRRLRIERIYEFMDPERRLKKIYQIDLSDRKDQKIEIEKGGERHEVVIAQCIAHTVPPNPNIFDFYEIDFQLKKYKKLELTEQADTELVFLPSSGLLVSIKFPKNDFPKLLVISLKKRVRVVKGIDKLVKSAKKSDLEVFLVDLGKIQGLVKVEEMKQNQANNTFKVKTVVYKQSMLYELSLKIDFSNKNIISLEEVKSWPVSSTDPQNYIYRPDGKLLYKINSQTFYNFEENKLYEKDASKTLEAILDDKTASQQQRRIRIKAWLAILGPQFTELREEGQKLLKPVKAKKR